VYMCICKT